MNDEEIKDRVKRYPERASYNLEDLRSILSRNFVCTVSFVDEGVPYAIPMMFANRGETIYLHGSMESRIYSVMRSSQLIAISLMELNGIVLASEIRNNSVNYVSALIFGRPVEVEDKAEKLQTFRMLTEKIAPGRWEDSIKPSEYDLNGVFVFSVKPETFSMKMRSGPPHDSLQSGIWSGVIPILHSYGNAGEDAPGYIRSLYGRYLFR
ncbi:pyridoxamine 5'-phosphate oxidase family protein [Thermoplasma sp. Kam2015]|uniref:pyridoxamine 5'-phosphate oxidase family protein n=1 Tax=Thermoplasma sp. Kam2015 TaxID=2094122 RepID=UPI000D8AEA20|nr:pyridoxamine 5'-phosphate oxidase family protein [Thermoplasma sp. Kam2015]PYB67629.1 pyridoxamine 5'-phosphate oxidase family protein [Thermoplasma sp. Kam2015]